MNKLPIVLIVLSMFFITSLAYAQKLGYVDLRRLFEEYNKTKDYDKILEDKQKTYESERESKVKDIKQLQDKIDLLSDKEKEPKKKELDAKIKALQEFDRYQTQDLRREKDEKMREILKDIESAISEYAKKGNYTLVFNDRVLVYQDKSLDITDEVLEILQKMYPTKK
ncbi:MAG: OmpH family outer membrane protein [Candidatus Omnitrophica bacterium]|nr:OmpH family outer membrane protein [Candidatus Omnitrophota bacterium]